MSKRRAAARTGIFAPLLLAASACAEQVEEKRDAPAADVASVVGGVAIEPGLWETTSEIVGVSAPGLPYEVRRRMIGPRPSARGCIGTERAARLMVGRSCSYGDFTMRDGRLGGTMRCPEPGLPRPTIAVIEGRYSPRRYDFTMRMEIAMPDGAAMRLDIRGRGRRTGDCAARPEPKGRS